jgi:hypothetical protein
MTAAATAIQVRMTDSMFISGVAMRMTERSLFEPKSDLKPAIQNRPSKNREKVAMAGLMMGR